MTFESDAVDRLASVLNSVAGKLHRGIVLKGFGAAHSYLETCPFSQ